MTGLASLAGFVLFALASALGGMTRFWFERQSVHRFGEHHPWGTLAANLLGSLVLGATYGYFAGGFTPDDVTQVAYTVFGLAAFCGAFTTFGGFVGQSFQRIRHVESRRWGWTYFVGTGVASVLMFAVGFLAMP